LPVIW